MRSEQSGVPVAPSMDVTLIGAHGSRLKEALNPSLISRERS